MRLKCYVRHLILIGAAVICGTTPSEAYMGDFISTADGDMAVLATIKSSDIDYDSEDTDAGDIDRNIIALVFSRSMSSKIKAFGSLNYAYDGELGGGDANLDSGYSISAGGSYMFWDQVDYAIQGYGQINYIFEETYEYSERNMDFTLDGYELLFGIMASYKIIPQLHAYGSFILIPQSDFTIDISSESGNDSWDIERETSFGFTGGLLYDLSTWFVKGEIGVGSEGAFGLSAGIKF